MEKCMFVRRLGAMCGIAIANALMAPSAHAQSVTVNVTNVTITAFNVYDTYAVVRYSPATATDPQCTGTNSAEMSSAVIDFGAVPNKKNEVAAVLSAYLAGKPIGIGMSGGSSCYLWGTAYVPVVYRIDL